MPARFIIDRTKNGQYYFILESGIQENLLTSEPFVFHISCMHTINSVRIYCENDYNYQDGMATNGEYFFVLRDQDHQILGTSLFYATRSWMLNAIARIKKEAATAIIEDHSK